MWPLDQLWLVVRFILLCSDTKEEQVDFPESVSQGFGGLVALENVSDEDAPRLHGELHVHKDGGVSVGRVSPTDDLAQGPFTI